MLDKEGRVLAACALAAGLVGATVVGSRALVRVKSDETIQVTGSAKRRIRSDQITWTAKISARNADMRAAYRSLAESVPKVTAFLEKKGIPKNEIAVLSVSTKALHPQNKDGRELEDVVSAWVLEQSIEVKSRAVDKVTEVSREVTELIDQGIQLESYAPEYQYTKIGDLKIQMIAEAARDAHHRAEEIAKATGATIGPLRSARMGVIQINPADSTETSNEGNNDTTSVDKDIISVVATTFALR
jgi:hypothetical protein